jgi:hypothetical protein
MRIRNHVLSAAATLSVAACQDAVTPVQPIAPQFGAATNVSASLSTRSVQFLPPMVAGSPTTATFDAGANPEVRLVPGASCSGAPVAVLATGGSGRSTLKLDEATATFHAVLLTRGLALATAGAVDYRLCVFEDDGHLGYLDVDVVDRQRDARHVAEGALGLALDAPLSIRLGVFGSTPAVGPPAAIVFTVQPTTLQAGATLSVAVEVRDAAGQVVTGATGDVSVALTTGTGAGGATLEGSSLATLSNGGASFRDLRLTRAARGYTLDVSFASLSATSAAFEVTAGPAASMILVRGDGQTATAGSAVSIPPEVLVSDAYGNAVAGQMVSFAVGLGGGVVSGATPVTADSGRAAVGSWVLGPFFGPNTLIVSTGSLPSLTVSALATFPTPF